jgi:hypothetical protein
VVITESKFAKAGSFAASCAAVWRSITTPWEVDDDVDGGEDGGEDGGVVVV